MLKVYTNTFFLKPEFRKQIFPILLDIHFLKNQKILKYYSIVEHIKDADIAMFPIEFSNALINFKPEVDQFISLAKKYTTPIWVYTGGDYAYSLEDKSIYNFRLGGFKSKLNKRSFILPSFINDPYDKNLNESFKPLPKSDYPKIGFVGHANNSFLKYISEYKNYLKINLARIRGKKNTDYQSFFPSSHQRFFCLERFKNNTKIISNFILRKKYRAGAKTQKETQETTKEFFQNLFENPYTFCMRGGGNFSVRFYETLATGRIPVVLDTDCLLPLDNNIDWHNHALIINYKDRENVDEILLEFHKNISKHKFIEIQNNNRLLWKNKLERISYFKQIHDIFMYENSGT